MPSIRFSLFAVLVGCGPLAACAAGAEPQPQSPQGPLAVEGTRVSNTERDAKTSARKQAAVTPANGRSRDQLVLGDQDPGSASTDHQVAELRQAIALYEQFIARAEHDSRYTEAVKRSRDRIDDAKATIEFLLAEPSQDP